MRYSNRHNVLGVRNFPKISHSLVKPLRCVLGSGHSGLWWKPMLCMCGRGVGGVSEVVRPKVGAAEGRVGGGGPGDLPRENFVKRHKILRSGLLVAHFRPRRSVQSSRVQYSVRLQMHNRSTSTSLENGQSLMRIHVHVCIDGS